MNKMIIKKKKNIKIIVQKMNKNKKPMKHKLEAKRSSARRFYLLHQKHASYIKFAIKNITFNLIKVILMFLDVEGFYSFWILNIIFR